MNNMSNNNDHFEILRKIQKKPNSTQRELADSLGFSLGKLNYCIKALQQKGLIKVNNKKIKAGQKVLFGDIIYIENFSEKIFANTRVKKIPKNISGELINKFKSSIIYENKDFIIIIFIFFIIRTISF